MKFQDYEEDVDAGAYGCCVTTYTGRTKVGDARYLNVTSVRDARTGLFVFLLSLDLVQLKNYMTNTFVLIMLLSLLVFISGPSTMKKPVNSN